VAYSFKLLFEERTISILAYSLKTVLAEKLETLLYRGTANTRMRDFYDIFALESTQSHNIDKAMCARHLPIPVIRGVLRQSSAASV
jgi:predicted nucleotidyltransferase component of viral defense system